MRTVAALFIALVACDGADAPGAPDGSVPAVDAGADASLPASCDAIPLVDANLEPWRVNTIDWLRQQGQRGAGGERQYGDTISIRGFRAPVDAASLGDSARDWLLSLPDFPTPAADVAVGEVKQVLAGSATVILVRERVGAVDARLFRPLASLTLSEDSDGVWAVLSVTVWASTALLDEAEARALEACSPAAPPPTAPILDTTFEGLTMRGCGVTGSYSYQPDERDRIEYADELDWITVGTQWRARRKARLYVDEANYWPEINGADCWCDDTAGFELEVDANSGEIFDYRPGINCVVC